MERIGVGPGYANRLDMKLFWMSTVVIHFNQSHLLAPKPRLWGLLSFSSGGVAYLDFRGSQGPEPPKTP